MAEIAARTGMLSIEEGKAERLAESLGGYFRANSAYNLDMPLTLKGSELADIAYMGPAGHHIKPEELAQLAAADGPVATTAKFRISLFTVGASAS
ncbi:hypothetical protein [Arthrobacter sp. StoSoilB13]|uniref:hypothetical protein n=1 Tax=Arthrobacter sp. StoSoilB13 TaxID=2830993 RepID=UPI00320A26E8